MSSPFRVFWENRHQHREMAAEIIRNRLSPAGERFTVDAVGTMWDDMTLLERIRNRWVWRFRGKAAMERIRRLMEENRGAGKPAAEGIPRWLLVRDPKSVLLVDATVVRVVPLNSIVIDFRILPSGEIPCETRKEIRSGKEKRAQDENA